MKTIFIAASVLLLTACTTITPPRYGISADNNAKAKLLPANPVSIGNFSNTAEFSAMCRGVGNIEAPDGGSYESYIRKALADELKLADRYSDSSSVAISGNLEKLAFSSSAGVTGGVWDIGVRLNSSNGTTMTASERYSFTAGFAGLLACRQVADSFMPAVQNLIGNILTSPEFKVLTKP